MNAPLMLDYAGPTPRERRGFFMWLWGALRFIAIFTIVLVIFTIRTVLLAAGVICIFAGTILLTLGGRRSAALTLNRWREHWFDLLHLWASDIARPFRRWRTRREPAL